MNAKLLLKTVFALLVLLLLVLLGMNNLKPVDFSLKPFVNSVKMPSALMYFAFFAIGVLTATVLFGGGGRKEAKATPATKPSRK